MNIKTTNKIILLFAIIILTIGYITPVLAADAYVTFNYRNEDNKSKSDFYEVGEEIRFPDPGTYRGHEFLGWSEDINDSRGEYFPGDKYKVTDDDSLRFYAIWKEEQSKRISFYPECGKKVSDIIYYSGETVKMPTTTKSGYKKIYFIYK